MSFSIPSYLPDHIQDPPAILLTSLVQEEVETYLSIVDKISCLKYHSVCPVNFKWRSCLRRKKLFILRFNIINITLPSLRITYSIQLLLTLRVSKRLPECIGIERTTFSPLFHQVLAVRTSF